MRSAWPLAAASVAFLVAAPAAPAVAQGFGSPGVQNVGPPEDALFPDLAALQDRLDVDQFRRWTLAGLWEDILDALNHAGIAPDKLQMVDSTVIRAHHHAAGAKGGLRKRLLAVREVASRPRSTSAATLSASLSRSR